MGSFTDGYEDTIKMKEVDNRYIQFPDGTVWRLSCSQLGKMLFDVEEGMEDGYDSVKFRVIYQEDNKRQESSDERV